MAMQKRIAPDVCFVLTAFVIGVLLEAILGMVLAATAFASGIVIVLPLVATFSGTREAGDSPAVLIDGSIGAALVIAGGFSLLCWMAATRFWKAEVAGSVPRTRLP